MAEETINRILVATDGSKESIEAARYTAPLARALKARVLLLHVVSDDSIPMGTVQLPLGTTPLRQGDEVKFESTLWEGAEVILDRTRRPFDQAGVPAEGLIREGEAAEEILAVAREEGSDLVVVGSRGVGAAERTLLGSTSERVVREAPCPVMVVRKGTARV